MAHFLDVNTDAQRFAAVLADYERRLQALERSTQAGYTSIEGGALDIYDDQGTLRGSVGVQPDGAVALVPVNAPPPPTPMPPALEPVLAGLLVTWDGQWDDADITPTDLTGVQVHLGPAPDFTPDPSTLGATITNLAGGTVTVSTATYTSVWVRLAAVNTGRVVGPASAAVQGIPRQVDGPDLSKLLDLATWLKDESVPGSKLVRETIGADLLAANSVIAGKVDVGALTGREIKAQSLEGLHIKAGTLDATHIKAGSLSADRLALGTDGNVIADPSFEGRVSEQRVAADEFWSIAAPGNGTARALQVSAANGAAVTRSMELAALPAVPGQKVWLAVDYLASADWDGVRISLSAQWLDATGAALGYSEVTTGADPAVKGAWTTMSGVPDTAAPAGTTQVRVVCSTVESSVGTVQYDNAACRMVMASGVAGARAEVSPAGLRLYDSSGEEAVALVTGRPNYLTLSADGTPVATIDQEGGAGFQTLAVADTLTIKGSDWTDHLNQYPRGVIALDYQASSVTNSSSGADMGFVELGFVAEAGRMYRTVLDCYASPSAAGGELQLTLRDGGSGAPLISSKQVQSAVYPLSGAALQRVRLEDLRSGESWGLGQHRILISFKNTNGPSGQTVRLFGGTNHVGFLYVEDVGPHVVETGGYNTGGGATTPPAQKYTRTYAASWSGTYANRSAYNGYYGNKCIQGYYSSTNGTQAALIGFPASLGTDLSGAKIIKAEVYLYFEHWYSNSGGRAVIKAHKHTSRPSSFSADSDSQSISWKRNEGKWVDITAVFDSSSWRGIALDPASAASTYYGVARGVGQANPPQLRVTFTK
ncbi:hypothetical protein [Streptomyces chrestomyceticus]|uniref:hypothetical protein n=1 Tax=Streptomyces chrestomyceticus TaxID=68185 RepID=UPI0033D49DC1